MQRGKPNIAKGNLAFTADAKPAKGRQQCWRVRVGRVRFGGLPKNEQLRELLMLCLTFGGERFMLRNARLQARSFLGKAAGLHSGLGFFCSICLTLPLKLRGACLFVPLDVAPAQHCVGDLFVRAQEFVRNQLASGAGITGFSRV